MDRVGAADAALTTLAVAGYVAGVVAPYPGRSFAISGVIVGLTLWAVGG